MNTSLVYFEDRYGVAVDRVLVTGVQSAQALQAAFSDRAIRVEELVSATLAGAAAGNVSAIGPGGRSGGPGFLMRININLATEPYEVARQYLQRMTKRDRCCGPWSRPSGGLHPLSALHTRDIDRQMVDVQRQIDALNHEKAQARAILNKPANRASPTSQNSSTNCLPANRCRGRASSTEMERIVPSELHVVSMKPDYTKTNELVVHVVVATDSRDRAVELVRHMEKSSHFRQPQVVAENCVDKPVGNRTPDGEYSVRYRRRVCSGRTRRASCRVPTRKRKSKGSAGSGEDNPHPGEHGVIAPQYLSQATNAAQNHRLRPGWRKGTDGNHSRDAARN